MQRSQVGEFTQRRLNVFVHERRRDEALAPVHDAMPDRVSLAQVGGEGVTQRRVVDSRPIGLDLARGYHLVVTIKQYQLERARPGVDNEYTHRTSAAYVVLARIAEA